MKISIITVSFNAARTIGQTIESVLSQKEEDIEYVIVDGNSKDESKDIIKKYAALDSRIKWISEPDSGLYDAMNKGIKMASGDIVGIINADDFFTNSLVLKGVKEAFLQEHQLDAVYGDVQFVSEGDSSKIVRKYSSSIFRPTLFRWGFMPAHPTFYCKRELFERFGYYSTDFKIAADYELLMRFIHTHKISTKYIPSTFVTMRMGGKSTKGFSSTLTINKEIVRACKLNNVNTSLPMLYLKYFYKIIELLRL